MTASDAAQTPGIKPMFDDRPVLETERLYIRELRVEDAADIYEYFSDPKVARYVTFEPHKSIEDTHTWLQRVVVNRAPNSGLSTWAIELKGAGKVIGIVGIYLDSEQHARAEIAYNLHKAYWGQGIITEAVRRMVQHGFEHLQLHRIQAHCHVDNTASLRVMLKAGMKHEGRLRGYVFLKGEWWDVEMCAIVREDWESSH